MIHRNVSCPTLHAQILLLHLRSLLCKSTGFSYCCWYFTVDLGTMLRKASLLLSHCPASSGPRSTAQKLSSCLALIALIFGTNSWGQGLNEHREWILLWELADQDCGMLEVQCKMPAQLLLAWFCSKEGNYNPMVLRSLPKNLSLSLSVWEFVLQEGALLEHTGLWDKSSPLTSCPQVIF